MKPIYKRKTREDTRQDSKQFTKKKEGQTNHNESYFHSGELLQNRRHLKGAGPAKARTRMGATLPYTPLQRRRLENVADAKSTLWKSFSHTLRTAKEKSPTSNSRYRRLVKEKGHHQRSQRHLIASHRFSSTDSVAANREPSYHLCVIPN